MRRHLSAMRSVVEPVREHDGRLDRQEPLSRWLSTSGPSDEWCGLAKLTSRAVSAFVAKVKAVASAAVLGHGDLVPGTSPHRIGGHVIPSVEVLLTFTPSRTR